MTDDGGEYPEGLTPGERRVLDYVREGTLDAEIGVRLGIPVGEVKDRIGRIVGKLGVRDRRDLVEATVGQLPPSNVTAPAWTWARPGSEVIDFTVADTAPEPDRPAATIDFTPLPVRAAPSKRPGRRLALVAVAAAGLLAVAALAAFFAFTGGADDKPASPAPVEPAAASGTTRAAPPAPASVLISEATVKDLPPNTVLYVETGCTNCNLGPTSLVRVWARANGEYEIKTLFTAPNAADGKPLEITGIAAGPGGKDLVIGVCDAGSCLFGGTITPDSRTTIYRTANGGITWSIAAEVRGGAQPILVSRDQPPTDYLLYLDVPMIGRQAVQMPSGKTIYRGGNVRNGPFSNGLWQSADGLISEADGRTVGRGEPIDFNVGWVELAQNGHWVAFGDSAMLMLQDPVSGAGDREYGLDSAGTRRAEMGTRRILSVARPERRLDPSYFFANVVPDLAQPQFRAQIFNAITYGTSPAFINVGARTVFFIAKPFDESMPGRNRILASATGRFVRVHDTGDCLNIRAEPNTTARILDCVFDGTLLKLRDVPTLNQGYTAISFGPDDTPAWVTSRYVED